MAKCPKCSFENPETQRFCGGCGSDFRLTPPGEAPFAGVDETARIPTVELPTGSLFAGRYQVIEELGRGGMGRVYRVLDRKLDLEIALKVVRPEIASDRKTLERFGTELKLARQIVHRNVARMFDLNEEGGVPYITMEYVRGENLQRLIRKVGRLEAGQATPIAKQICAGLAEAHRLGIVHRDLKPQNIMIDEDGKAQIMDFGIARLQAADDQAERGRVAGTPAYISPEQIEGRDADGRADLYSLGVVLYEMLTGRPPFKSDIPRDLLRKHLSEEPPNPCQINPDIPDSLCRVILRCLKKQRETRFQSAEEVLEALDQVEQDISTGHLHPPIQKSSWTRFPVAVWRHKISRTALGLAMLCGLALLIVSVISPGLEDSIAVLPVENYSPKQDIQNLGYGLQNDISEKLLSIPKLRVVPPLTVQARDLKDKSSTEIGRSLEARYLLKLTLQAEESRLRIKVVLIDARRDFIVRQYAIDRDIGSYFSLQDEVSLYISRALGADLAEEQLRNIKMREPRNLEAYNLYLEGTRLIEEEYPLHNDATADVFEKATEMFRRAIAIDPNYALAYWAMGNAYENKYYSATSGGDSQDQDRMYEYYLTAFNMNRVWAETNLGLGWYHFNRGENSKAHGFFRRAIELEPRKAIVQKDAGAFLRSIGMYEQAIACLTRAARLDPVDPDPVEQISQCRMYLGQIREAVRMAEKAVSMNPTAPRSHKFLATQYIMLENFEGARKEIEAIRKIEPGYKGLKTVQALLAAGQGEKDAALALQGGDEILTPDGTWFYLRLGMTDEAIANIEAGIQSGFEKHGMYLYSYPCLSRNPFFRRLRDDRRFQSILKEQKAKYRDETKSYQRF